MSSKQKKIAIVDKDKCKPHKCNKECKNKCPVEKMGIECVTIETEISDIENIVISSKKNNKLKKSQLESSNKNQLKRKYAKINESTCTGCKICTNVCPFNAIKIIQLPSEIKGNIIHRYNKNGFRLYKLPIIKQNQVLGLLSPNGMGKCLDENQPVLLYNGEIKKAKDILITDTLMGDDSTPRHILSLTSGEDDMFEIIPSQGRSYKVNSQHILTILPIKPYIRISRKKKSYKVYWINYDKITSNTFKTKTEAKNFIKTINTNPIDMPVSDFINTTRLYKRYVYGYRVAVNFNNNDFSLPFDPYFLGYWLGNRHATESNMIILDAKILRKLNECLEKHDLILKKTEDEYKYSIQNLKDIKEKNHFEKILTDLNLVNNKHIPHIYKTCSRQNRLQLLSGLIDSNTLNGNIRLVMYNRNKILAEDIEYVSLSLGFVTIIKSSEEVGNPMYKISILGDILKELQLFSGKGFGVIYTKKPLLNNLKVKYIGKGRYHGFQISGNGRFLLSDFTVTHNSTILQILSKSIEPNFEIFDKKFEKKEILSKFKGTELHKYFSRLYNSELSTSVKHQHVELLIKYLSFKKLDPTIKTYLFEKSSYKEDDEFYKYVIETLELNNIYDSKVKTLSGGELQRVVCASTLLKKADVYIFDEPTNYLDIKQRLNVARLIRSLSKPNIYVIVIDHDISILDYLADYICILYGTPGAFGIVSNPIATANAINIYFDGYIPSENMRFRETAYSFKELNEIISSIEITNQKDEITSYVKYPKTDIIYPNFHLTIKEGNNIKEPSITIILGCNGSGKTSFINYIAKTLETTISCKPQYIDKIDQFKISGSYPTVDEFLNKEIQTSYYDDMFRSDVVKPLNIHEIKNRKLNQLSGGELQKVWLIYCLGKPSKIYLIDEPSSCLDCEQRVIVTKIIKKFMIHNKKIGFIVEHDLTMAVSLAQDYESNIIVMENVGERKFVSSEPLYFKEGINRFLKIMNVTIRTETVNNNNRPRINKINSTKDREQKLTSNYYL
jgi:Predicted ATPase, RNase L inhibitor (RLI) homolog